MHICTAEKPFSKTKTAFQSIDSTFQLYETKKRFTKTKKEKNQNKDSVKRNEDSIKQNQDILRCKQKKEKDRLQQAIGPFAFKQNKCLSKLFQSTHRFCLRFVLLLY